MIFLEIQKEYEYISNPWTDLNYLMQYIEQIGYVVHILQKCWKLGYNTPDYYDEVYQMIIFHSHDCTSGYI